MELFYHNNLYLVSIYYIGEIEIISRNLSIKCINKLRPFFLYRKRLPGQYTAPRIGFSQTPYHSSRPMCTTEGTLAVWALKLAPSHHPCMTYSLFSSRSHLPFKYFFRDKLKPKHSIMEGLSPPFLVESSTKLSWEWWVPYLCFCASVTCCLKAKLSAPCSVLNCAERAGA